MTEQAIQEEASQTREPVQSERDALLDIVRDVLCGPRIPHSLTDAYWTIQRRFNERQPAPTPPQPAREV